jgi:predicted O-methyltransferase YrrM
MEFIDEMLSLYCEQHCTEEDEILKALSRETHLKSLSPRMLSGHLQGTFLSFISQILQAQMILEIGTFTGYSALCMAKGLGEKGKLITIDYNPEIESIARKYFALSDHAYKIDFRIGDAKAILPTLTQNFDLVFIDADKRAYSLYYDLVIDKLRSGGVIIADNVLWSAKVIDKNANDEDTIALRSFNEKVKQDSRVTCCLLPIRDGLMMIRKL